MRISRDGDRIAVSVNANHAIVVAAVVVGLLGGGALYAGVRAVQRARLTAQLARQAGDVPTLAEIDPVAVGSAGRPARGPSDAPVTIVEFTDYECPFCRRQATEVLPAVLARSGDRVRYVVRNFPLAALHPLAIAAAQAAECVDHQGRFWDFHDALMRERRPLTVARIREQAAAVGVDAGAFEQCWQAEATRAIVARDLLDGWELGVTGTPTLFINGRRVRGALTAHQLEDYIDQALAAGGR
jgi:protein-disulfide isomerase